MNEPGRDCTVLEIRGLCKRFGKLEAVKDLSLNLERGDVFGFIGPNGAGKTTTIRMLATLLQPTSGTALIGGYDVFEDPERVRGFIGYMPDFFGTYDSITVWEYLDFFAGAFRIKRRNRKTMMEDVMQLVDLTWKRDALVGSLSRGMKQRLCLAKTLIHDPQLLLLDEPASGLDPRARIEIKELLKELRKMGKTIFISSHILTELADLCNKVGIIEEGRLLVAGDVRDILDQVRPLRKVRIRILGDAEPALRILKNLPRVEGAAGEGSVLTFQFSAGDEELSEVTEALVREKVKIVSFHEESAGLEEIFMKVTKGVVS